MNRIEDKGMVTEAAKYFKEEVRKMAPGIDREELCEMVDEYIYYQQDDMTRAEAHKVVEETCLKK